MKVGVVANQRYAGLRDLLSELSARAAAHGMELYPEPRLAELWPDSAPELRIERDRVDFLMTFGGDGTLLRGARLLEGRPIPILGINLGRVGVRATAAPATLDAAIAALAAGEYAIEERCTLTSCTQSRSGLERRGALALNDLVVHKAGVARVIHVRVNVDGEAVGQYSADGIIVATPTGSTAYSLSAGGPIVVPGVDALVITAICPHTLAVRPLVVPGTAKVELEWVEPWVDEVLISYDGQVGHRLEPGDRILVRQSDNAVRLLRIGNEKFFARMRGKLQWGDLMDRERR